MHKLVTIIYWLLCMFSPLLHSCNNVANQKVSIELTDKEAIINAAISYQFIPRQVCEQDYDDSFSKDTFEAFFSEYSIPAFDTMPCYSALYFLHNDHNFTERECVIVDVGVLDSIKISQLFPAESVIRANVFLGRNKKALNENIDYSKLDFSKMGGKLIRSGEPCDRRHASISCFLSEVYVDETGEKAVLYMRLFLSSEYKYVHYFHKVGQLWLLTVRENVLYES
ncbi:MAG: hypothetical protein NXI25_15435 [bacterium]|nr:hypothetical protein [bacterium]